MKSMNDEIVKRRLAALLCALAVMLAAFAGGAVAEEARLCPGRWIQPGVRIVYGDEDSVAVSDGEKSDAQEDFVFAASASTVEEKVELLAEACTAAGMEDDYEIALWMHDWLIYNANYDYTYTEYGPEGVLLKGTGVCQSYAMAYELLLDRMGIDNRLLSSPEMDHAWNLVCIDGVWCHVDCTWDDPNEGGLECRAYFGMNDALMARDHDWDRSAYAACTSMEKYYPVYFGLDCVDSQESLGALLEQKAGAQEDVFEIYYIGASADFSLRTAVEDWVNANYSSFGVSSFGCHGSDYILTVELTYRSSGEAEDNEGALETPVPAPDFAMNSLNGCYRLSDYAGNGMVLVFGRSFCGNTVNLATRLENEVEDLAEAGVEVLFNLEDASGPSELVSITANLPAVKYVCGQSELMWDYLEVVGDTSNSVTFPAVFVINGEGMITYYSTGYVSDSGVLLSEAYAVSTGKELPQPGENDYSQGSESTGSISGLTSSGAQTLKSLAAQSSCLIYMTDAQLYYDLAELLAEYEADYELFSRLGIGIAASFETSVGTDALEAYPHVDFFAYDEAMFWELRDAAGFGDERAYYRNFFLIGRDGDIIRYINGYSEVMNPHSVAIDQTKKAVCEIITPADLYGIEAEAFRNSAVESVDLTGSPLYSIGDSAFADCESLELVKVPKSVQSISASAFDGCDNLLILCDVGSAAHAFAEANGILCLAK